MTDKQVKPYDYRRFQCSIDAILFILLLLIIMLHVYNCQVSKLITKNK